MSENLIEIATGIIIGLMAGIIVGLDAKKRGMSPWAWGSFVFFIIAIGLPAYFIFRKPKIMNY